MNLIFTLKTTNSVRPINNLKKQFVGFHTTQYKNHDTGGNLHAILVTSKFL
jgi:hypothetical protein